MENLSFVPFIIYHDLLPINFTFIPKFLRLLRETLINFNIYMNFLRIFFQCDFNKLP